MLIKTLLYIIIISPILSQDNKWKFSADGSAEFFKKDNESIQKFTDNVHIYNDSLSLYTDEAWEYKNKNQIHLSGNTLMISNDDSLKCDSMIYWIDKDSLLAIGNVSISFPVTRNNISGLEPIIVLLFIFRWNIYGDGFSFRSFSYTLR